MPESVFKQLELKSASENELDKMKMQNQSFMTDILNRSNTTRISIQENKWQKQRTFKLEVEKIMDYLIKELNKKYKDSLFEIIEKSSLNGETYCTFNMREDESDFLKIVRNHVSNEIRFALGTIKNIVINWLFSLKDPKLEKNLDGFIIRVSKDFNCDVKTGEMINISIWW